MVRGQCKRKFELLALSSAMHRGCRRLLRAVRPCCLFQINKLDSISHKLEISSKRELVFVCDERSARRATFTGS
jgi:hypothetical protein